jgi:site-specific DNA recombinase
LFASSIRLTRAIQIIRATKNNGSNWRGPWAGWKRGKNLSVCAAIEKDTSMATPTNTGKLRAALYARFSSDIQKDRSIDRQFADLEKAAQRLGLKLDKRHYFSDRAQSGASLIDRPGLTRELLGASERREFDVVLVEATDRLSRNQSDLHWLSDHFKFNDNRIFTPSGEVTALQMTFEGHQNADFLEKLSYRIKSGHDEVVREGLIPNGPAYGYDCVPGKPGIKVINKAEAEIVNRIFREYVAGSSPRTIAAGLMADKIPSPSGKPHWNFQCIVGGEGKKRGMLNNQLYVGVYLKNRYKNIKNPSTGKIITRKAEADELITAQHPELRIIAQPLWDAAQKRRKALGFKRHGSGQVQREVVPRIQHLLAGLLRCAECGGSMCIVARSRDGARRVECSAAYNSQSCKHEKTYNLDKLTAAAVYRMHKHLTDPEFLKEKAKGKLLETARLNKEKNGDLEAAQKQYDRLDIQIKKLVRALDDDNGHEIPKELLASLKAKEIERKGLEERLRVLGASTNVVAMPANVIKAFGQSIETLHEMLKRNPHDPECRTAFANVIDRILVHPTGFGEGYEISLYARLAAIKGGIDLFPKVRSNEEIIAAEGLPRGSIQSPLIHH